MRDLEGDTIVLAAVVSAVSSESKGKKMLAPHSWYYSSEQRLSRKTVVTLILRFSF
jgi:hypothetical protein